MYLAMFSMLFASLRLPQELRHLCDSQVSETQKLPTTAEQPTAGGGAPNAHIATEH